MAADQVAIDVSRAIPIARASGDGVIDYHGSHAIASGVAGSAAILHAQVVESDQGLVTTMYHDIVVSCSGVDDAELLDAHVRTIDIEHVAEAIDSIDYHIRITDDSRSSIGKIGQAARRGDMIDRRIEFDGIPNARSATTGDIPLYTARAEGTSP